MSLILERQTDPLTYHLNQNPIGVEGLDTYLLSQAESLAEFAGKAALAYLLRRYINPHSNNYDPKYKDREKAFMHDPDPSAHAIFTARNINIPMTSALEVGCGNGRDIRYLADQFPDADIVGTDMSSNAVKLANSYDNPGNASFVHAPDGRLPGSQKFDLITANSVLHLIPFTNIQDFLSQIEQSLKPGGMFSFAIKTPPNPSAGANEDFLVTDISEHGIITAFYPDGLTRWHGTSQQVKAFLGDTGGFDLLSTHQHEPITYDDETGLHTFTSFLLSRRS